MDDILDLLLIFAIVMIPLFLMIVFSASEEKEEIKVCKRHIWELVNGQLICKECKLNPVLEAKLEQWNKKE